LYLIYLIAGRSLDLIWLLQAGMGAISCGLTYLIARKIVGERAGWLAAFLLVFLVSLWIPWTNHKFPLLRWRIVGVIAGILVAVVPFMLRKTSSPEAQ